MEQELNEVQQAFGNKVCKARLQKKLSKKQLAKQAHMSLSHITAIETGRCNATLDTIRRFGNVLGKRLKYFLPLHLLYCCPGFADCLADVLM